MKMNHKESPSLTVLSLLLPCLLLGLQAGCRTNPSIAAELQPLQGTWEGVALNKNAPDGSFVKSADTITITVTGNSFHFYRDTNFWFETTITLPAGTEPQQLHSTIQGNAPAQGSDAICKVVVALLKIEGETLTLATRGDSEAPMSFEDENLTRYELKRVQPRNKNTQPPKPK
jgi:uncharacterized protein (TIGR03067 family)